VSEYQLLRHIGTKLIDDVAGDVAGDVDVDRTAVMTWRVSPTRFAEAGRRWSVAGVRRVGARGQSGRRRVLARAGMQDVGSSPGLQQWIRPVVLYTMVCSKTRLENFDF
jgi:hypothetical protein